MISIYIPFRQRTNYAVKDFSVGRIFPCYPVYMKAPRVEKASFLSEKSFKISICIAYLFPGRAGLVARAGFVVLVDPFLLFFKYERARGQKTM